MKTVKDLLKQLIQTKVSDDSSSELKKLAQDRGIDTAGLSVAQLEKALGESIWTETHPNEEMPPQIAPMLIEEITSAGKDYISKNFKSDRWFAQNKLNGMRFILVINPDGSTHMTSRSRSVKTFRFNELDGRVLGLLNIKSPFKGRVILDGEIKCPVAEIELPSGEVTKSTLQSTVGLMHLNVKQSLELQEKYGSLVFNVFDILMLDGESTEQLPYEERADLVYATVKTLVEANPGISLKEVPVIKDYEDAWELFEEYTGRGEEGIILKDRKAPYEQGKRVKTQLKVKAFSTVDAFITGFVPSSKGKKYENLIGGLKFSSYVDGVKKEIAAISNIPESLRKNATSYDENNQPILNPEYLNQCYELIGQDFNKKSMRLNSARISERRQDKNPEDCQIDSSKVKYNTEV